MSQSRTVTPEELQADVWEYYRLHGRALPWREPQADGSFEPYRILVSEFMLQQTQVNRVVPKYLAFLQRFPHIHTLADATLADVLTVWSGLGYNRRAKYLWQAAQKLNNISNAWTADDLEQCVGIGPNTAAAIMVYAYNQPMIFIETNIRTVLIHHFFPHQDNVHDRDLLPLMTELLDVEHPREFYWALMDYGTHLKQVVGNAARSSKHYARQSKFEGSKRQLRGEILRQLGSTSLTEKQLANMVRDERLPEVLGDLVKDALIRIKDGQYHLG